MQMRPWIGSEEKHAINSYMEEDGFLTEFKKTEIFENSIAKFVAGISDNLATNIFSQAGKCKVPCVVLACDTEPEHDTKAPSKMVKVFPRKIDLHNTEKLKSFELTTVVSSVSDLKKVLKKI